MNDIKFRIRIVAASVSGATIIISAAKMLVTAFMSALKPWLIRLKPGRRKIGKSRLVIILITILGILGLSIVISLLTNGMRVGKMVATANTFNKTLKTSKSTIRNDSYLPPSKVIDYAKGGKSAFDTGRAVHDNNKREKNLKNAAANIVNSQSVRKFYKASDAGLTQ